MFGSLLFYHKSNGIFFTTVEVEFCNWYTIKMVLMEESCEGDAPIIIYHLNKFVKKF